MKKIRFCPCCSQYTLKESHCDNKTRYAHPPLFNPNDSYGKYRRKEKGMEN